MGHQHLAGGRRHCDQGVATKIELRDGNYNGKGQGTDGGGEVLESFRKYNKEGSSLIDARQNSRREASRFNYFNPSLVPTERLRK